MIYTLYWETRQGKLLTKEEVEKCVKAIKSIIDKNKEIVEIEFKGKSELNKWNINFNGVGDDAYETFCFYSYFDENPAEMVLEALDENKKFCNDYISINGELKCAYCKTDKKPYDKLVKKALIECQKITNNKFKITDDEGFEYLKNGKKRIEKKGGNYA